MFRLPPDRPQLPGHSARPKTRARVAGELNPLPHGWRATRNPAVRVISCSRFAPGSPLPKLDPELARGADPASDPFLARRAYSSRWTPRTAGARSLEDPVRRADALPKGMTCADYRLRKQPERGPSSWLRIAARVLAVAGYHAGVVQPYRRD